MSGERRVNIIEPAAHDAAGSNDQGVRGDDRNSSREVDENRRKRSAAGRINPTHVCSCTKSALLHGGTGVC